MHWDSADKVRRRSALPVAPGKYIDQPQKVGAGGTARRTLIVRRASKVARLRYWWCAGRLILLAVIGLAQTVLAASPRLPFADDVFPLAVWLQQPVHAQKYKNLGINLYVGLWQGPTAAQLATLKQAGMPVICEQNEAGLSDRNRDIIIGWLQQDEPDNAQPLVGKIGAARLGWGSPVSPAEMQERYRAMRARDPSRPVLLGLGKGVAWDSWKGRGNRTGHPEDYPQYVKAGDILAFDIYPAAETDPALAGRLEVVAGGVKRLLAWAGPERTVWNTIGTSKVKNPDAVVNPQHIRSQVWMSIINGARGIIYFVHQFEPRFVEATWFESPDIAAAIGRINAEVQGLAKVILSPASGDIASIGLRDENLNPVPSTGIAVTSRRKDCRLYVFATSLSSKPLRAGIQLRQAPGTLDVIGEGRPLPASGKGFEDDFQSYAVHLYVSSARNAFCE